MIILDLHFINSTESVPMRFSHRRTVKMNKKNKRKRKNNPIKFYKKFPKIKQVKNTKKRKTTSTLSNDNNNNNNKKKKQKTKLTFDEQRKYFKRSYDLMHKVQSLDELNNECLDEETLIECLYISCFNDNDDNIATFLAHGLSLEPPVDFLVCFSFFFFFFFSKQKFCFSLSNPKLQKNSFLNACTAMNCILLIMIQCCWMDTSEPASVDQSQIN